MSLDKDFKLLSFALSFLLRNDAEVYKFKLFLLFSGIPAQSFIFIPVVPKDLNRLQRPVFSEKKMFN